jgi:hypothetical protein
MVIGPVKTKTERIVSPKGQHIKIQSMLNSIESNSKKAETTLYKKHKSKDANKATTSLQKKHQELTKKASNETI